MKMMPSAEEEDSYGEEALSVDQQRNSGGYGQIQKARSIQAPNYRITQGNPHSRKSNSRSFYNASETPGTLTQVPSHQRGQTTERGARQSAKSSGANNSYYLQQHNLPRGNHANIPIQPHTVKKKMHNSYVHTTESVPYTGSMSGQLSEHPDALGGSYAKSPLVKSGKKNPSNASLNNAQINISASHVQRTSSNMHGQSMPNPSGHMSNAPRTASNWMRQQKQTPLSPNKLNQNRITLTSQSQ